jgi:hypothetical protein
VVGGGAATPAPNVTAISNTPSYDGLEFSITSNFTLPANYQYINQMDMRVIAFQSDNTTVDADNDIGVVNYFDFVAPAFNSSTNIFTFKHGPYLRPDTGNTQDWAVAARVASGIGIWTASPFQSSHSVISGPSVSGSDATLQVSSPTFTQGTGQTSSDGTATLVLSFTWVDPTNTDAAFVTLVLRDVSGGGAPDIQILQDDLAGLSLYGLSRSYSYNFPSINTQLQAIWNVTNAAGDPVGGTAMNVYLTPTSAQLKLSKLDSSTYNVAQFQLISGKFNVNKINVALLEAGTATINITYTGTLIVPGTGGGYQTTISPALGVEIDSVVNSSKVSLSPGWVAVSGQSVSINNFSVLSSLSLTIKNPSLDQMSLTTGGILFYNAFTGQQVALLSNSSGGSLQLPVANSFIIVNGQYRLNLGGFSQTIIDQFGNWRSVNYSAGVTAFPANYIGLTPVYNSSGTLVGHHPVI